MQRMDRPQALIDIEYFGDRIAEATAPSLLMVGQRNLGEDAAVVPIGRAQAFRALVGNMVVGLGVYQGLEFLLERGAWELMGKSGLVASHGWRTASRWSGARAPAASRWAATSIATSTR